MIWDLKFFQKKFLVGSVEKVTNIEVTAPIPAALLNEAVSENTSTKRQNYFLSEEMAGIIMGKKPEEGEELKKKEMK